MRSISRELNVRILCSVSACLASFCAKVIPKIWVECASSDDCKVGRKFLKQKRVLMDIFSRSDGENDRSP
jgi:hypothetical protein